MKKFILPLLIVLSFGFLSTGFVVDRIEYRNAPIVQQQIFDNSFASTCRIKMSNCFGSGVVIYSEKDQYEDYNTYVLTCAHLFFEDGKIVHLEFFNKDGSSKEKVQGKLIALNPVNEMDRDPDGNIVLDMVRGGEDLVIIKLDSTKQFPVAKLPTMEQALSLKMLDKVRVIGAPLADKLFPTFGEIARVEKDFLMINAPAIFGNSGCGVFLQTGELIGILNAGRAAGQQFITHLVFVRPIDNAYAWFDKIGYSFLYTKVGAQKAFDNEKSLEIKNQLKELNDKLLKIQDIMGERDALRSEIDVLLKRIDALEKRLENLEKSKNDSPKSPELKIEE